MTKINSARKELADHRGSISENQWLTDVGILDSPETPYTIDVISDWHMPGSESYVLDFAVNSQHDSKRLIAKACIKSCATETVREWHDRRARIKSAGIEVPKLYSTNRAVYIEEFIEMDLHTAFNYSNEEERDSLADRFIDTYLTLGRIGFNVISLHDARSRGDDIVLIDFGSDIGGYSEGSKDDATINEKAQRELDKIRQH